MSTHSKHPDLVKRLFGHYGINLINNQPQISRTRLGRVQIQEISTLRENNAFLIRLLWASKNYPESAQLNCCGRPFSFFSLPNSLFITGNKKRRIRKKKKKKKNEERKHYYLKPALIYAEVTKKKRKRNSQEVCEGRTSLLLLYRFFFVFLFLILTQTDVRQFCSAPFFCFFTSHKHISPSFLHSDAASSVLFKTWFNHRMRVGGGLVFFFNPQGVKDRKHNPQW